MLVEEMITQYQVDEAHARRVADYALLLFDAVREAYDIPASGRRLLEIGALLHNVGMTTNPAKHHTVGRDVVLRHDLDTLSANEQAVVACLVVFHRKKVRPQSEPAYLSLGRKKRDLVLQLAALLRVADGLDYSQTQSTAIMECTLADDSLHLILDGPQSNGDGERAVAKADLWNAVFGTALAVTSDRKKDKALANGSDDTATIEPWYGSSESSLATFGQMLLRRHFRRMLTSERGIQADADIEAVHQFRVASRRLRAMLQLLGEVAPQKQVQEFRKSLRRLAKAAGAVRDLDVFLAHISTASADQQSELEALAALLHRDRKAAHKHLVSLLKSDDYDDFKRGFADFTTSDAKWDSSLRVRDRAASAIWWHYEQLRAYDDETFATRMLEDSAVLHETRIEGKRLRYVLEMFNDVFDGANQPVLEPLVALQENLGTLNDTTVASAYIAKLDVPDETRAVLDAYMAQRREEQAQIQAELPKQWRKLTQLNYRRQIGALVARL